MKLIAHLLIYRGSCCLVISSFCISAHHYWPRRRPEQVIRRSCAARRLRGPGHPGAARPRARRPHAAPGAESAGAESVSFSGCAHGERRGKKREKYICRHTNSVVTSPRDPLNTTPSHFQAPERILKEHTEQRTPQA